jgi:integrase
VAAGGPAAAPPEGELVSTAEKQPKASPKKSPKKPRRANGSGSIYQLPDGRWTFNMSLGMEGTKRRRKVIYCQTQREAEIRRSQARDAGEFSRRRRGSVMSLGDYADAWIEAFPNRPQKYKATTSSQHKIDVEKYIKPLIGRVKLAELDTLRVEEWLNEMARRGVGLAAISRARRCLSTILSEALHDKKLADNPVKNLSPSRVPTYKAPEAATLSAKQLSALFSTLATHRLGAMVVLAATTTMRQSESIGLRWSDIDLGKGERRREGTVHIRRNIVLVDAVFHEDTPKTEASERNLRLPAVTVRALRIHRWLAYREQKAVETKVPTKPRMGRPKKPRAPKYPQRYDARGLVFTNRLGWAVQRGYLLDYVLRPALTAGGLPSVTWHQLRHSCATVLIEQGVPIEAVSRTLGHANVTTTLQIYNKAFRARERLSADAMDAALAAVSGVTPPQDRDDLAIKLATVPKKVEPLKKEIQKKKPR